MKSIVYLEVTCDRVEIRGELYKKGDQIKRSSLDYSESKALVEGGLAKVVEKKGW